MDLFSLSKEEYANYMKAFRVVEKLFPEEGEAVLRLAVELVDGLEEKAIKGEISVPGDLTTEGLSSLDYKIRDVHDIALNRICQFVDFCLPYAGIYEDFYRICARNAGFFEYFYRINEEEWKALLSKCKKENTIEANQKIFAEVWGEDFIEMLPRLIQLLPA